MNDKTVLWEVADGVGRITLNRPQSLNAWTAEFGAELRDIVTGPAADESVRAVLITGAGRGFSSGADLKAGFDPHPDDGLTNHILIGIGHDLLGLRFALPGDIEHADQRQCDLALFVVPAATDVDLSRLLVQVRPADRPELAAPEACVEGRRP